MISHEHKCIFIHIPRTGGTSVEMWLGGDKYLTPPPEVHIIASHAKRLYSQYWDSYFKFSIVRHPVDRVLSTLAFSDEFGITRTGGKIDFSKYLRLFNIAPAGKPPVITEYDYRYNAPPPPTPGRYSPHTVYGNILDEPLDFIGRTEDLAAHMAELGAVLKVKKPFDKDFRYMMSVARRVPALDPETVQTIESLYRDDYGRFGYPLTIGA